MKKALKITLITLASVTVVSAIVVPTVLYFTIWQKTFDGIDLDEQNLEYLAKVEYMDKISNPEATTIKTEIKSKIIAKLTALSLEENIDYEITNLDSIKGGDDLNDFLDTIIIESIASSEKTRGSFAVTLNVQENITNRSKDMQVFEIDKAEENDLTEETANSLLNRIPTRVQALLNRGQTNTKDTDYKITGLEKIKKGARFDEYNGNISVQAISQHLTGSFLVVFKIA